MQFKNRDIIAIGDFSKEEILHVLDVAASMDTGRASSDMLKGKILANLFFEASTRTRLSFDSSMNRLGGSVIGFSEPSMTSIAKGETLKDTIRIIDGYCDVIVIRHPEEGSASVAAESAEVPVINAGDGPNEHPTQTLLDLFTIKKATGKLEGLTIGFLGDLKYGRTVHSLTKAFSLFGPKMYFIAPQSLTIPEPYIKDLEKKKIEFVLEEDLFKVSKELDILYVTRIQKERFLNPEDYAKVRGVYRLDNSLLNRTKPSVKILHPLPRVDEINPNLDNSEQSIYFEQAHNGIALRKALLALVLGAVQ